MVCGQIEYSNRNSLQTQSNLNWFYFYRIAHHYCSAFNTAASFAPAPQGALCNDNRCLCPSVPCLTLSWERKGVASWDGQEGSSWQRWSVTPFRGQKVKVTTGQLMTSIMCGELNKGHWSRLWRKTSSVWCSQKRSQKHQNWQDDCPCYGRYCTLHYIHCIVVVDGLKEAVSAKLHFLVLSLANTIMLNTSNKLFR